MTLAESREQDPTFPPLLSGEEVAPGQDPFAKAVALASLGTDAGRIVWARDPSRLAAAVVLAPDEPLERAIGVVFAVALGLGDALGALAPPEVAVHYVWPGGFRVNGAQCGELRAAAATDDPGAIPDWLVVGVTLPYLPPADTEPGADPDRTALVLEGCGEVTPLRLLESWSRHMLVWINRFIDEGLAPLHAAWRDRGWGIGEALPGSGVFMGLDDLGGQLVKTPSGTELRPLTVLLEERA